MAVPADIQKRMDTVISIYTKLPPKFRNSPNMIKAIGEFAKLIPDPVARKKFGEMIVKDHMAAMKALTEARNNQGWLSKAWGAVKKVPIAGSVAKLVEKGVAFGVKVAGNVALAPLIPFIPAMRRKIKEEGHKPKGDLLGLANQFRKVVLAKQSFDCYDYDGNINPARFEKNYIAGIAVGTLVPLILKFFKGLKDKKASGEPLSKSEETILKEVEKAEETIEEEVTKEVNRTTGEWIMDNKKALIITGIGIIATTGIVIGISYARKAKAKKAA